MFLVLVKVSSVMPVSYVESLGPEKGCDHDSRKTIRGFLFSFPPAFRELMRMHNFETSVVTNWAENNQKHQKLLAKDR